MIKLIFKFVHPLVRSYWKIFRPKTYGSRAIILHENNILLVRNIDANYWSLPGGKIESGETPEQCLVRELKEELNLAVQYVDYKLGEYISEKEGKRDTVHIFVVRLLSSYFKKQWELEDARWFNLTQLPQNTSPATSRRIIEFQRNEKGLMNQW